MTREVAAKSTAICVLGMHRSGTSLLAQMLGRCGVYLGEEERLGRPGGSDNPGGYWEHAAFRKLNDRILERLGGTWKSLPEFGENWAATHPGLGDLRQEARTVLDRFRGREVWGWKDPRNALTLPFWQELVPGLRGVVLFRNPVQVAMSMQARRLQGNLKFSVPFHTALNLWLAYYQNALKSIEGRSGYAIVHYDALLHDPETELQRILELVGVPYGGEKVEEASRLASGDQNRNSVSDGLLKVAEIPPQIREMYAALSAGAGPQFRSIAKNAGYQRRRKNADSGILYRKLVEAWAAIEDTPAMIESEHLSARKPPLPLTLADLDIVVVHYRHYRPTVAMLNALFRHYPEVDVTLVDNSGGQCPVIETVLPYLGSFSSQIHVIVNSAGDSGDAGRFSHGAGIDLACAQSERLYLLSMETDTFVLERGCIEFVMSLMDAGYEWAGLGQKPIDGVFHSFSPSFAIFRTDLIRAYGLSFRRRSREPHERDSDDPLIRHHRQTAERVRNGLPPDYPDGKPPNTYRQPPERIIALETAHESYFDTGEWVHRFLSQMGHRGYLFRTLPSVCHTWGSRDETLFLENFRHQLPDEDLNAYLPPALQVATDLKPIVLAGFSFSAMDKQTLAEHWHWQDGAAGELTVSDDTVLQVDVNVGAEGKAYLIMGEGRPSEPPPARLGTRIAPNALSSLECTLETSGSLRVALWLIEYGGGKRIQHRVCSRARDGRYRLDFVTSAATDSFRVLFRFVGTGSARIGDLTMLSGE
ncbi:MAG: hypothetical protein CMM50_14945 [Rhodospirillaceae bacterium]|nr:hypothetical protein [Rhodospirillaceae bacterium]